MTVPCCYFKVWDTKLFGQCYPQAVQSSAACWDRPADADIEFLCQWCQGIAPVRDPSHGIEIQDSVEIANVGKLENGTSRIKEAWQKLGDALKMHWTSLTFATDWIARNLKSRDAYKALWKAGCLLQFSSRSDIGLSENWKSNLSTG